MPNTLQKKIEILIEKAVCFISTQQNADGSFSSLSSADADDFTSGERRLTTFQASLILGALSGIAKTNPCARAVCQKASRFLLNQKSKQWSWNYWARESPEAKTNPYPDDLDDTFLALSTLYTFDKSLIDTEGLAHVVKLLTKMEVKEGGPYRTWITTATKDVRGKNTDEPDVVVNTSIAYFLSLNEIDVPGLRNFIMEKIQKGNFWSAYYPSADVIAYFISRLYHEELYQKMLGQKMIQSLDEGNFAEGHERNGTLQCAVRLSTLIRLGAEHKEIRICLKNLLEKLSGKSGNGWQAQGFCVDPTRDGQKYYGGSAALSAALSAEALWLFTEMQKYRAHGNKTTENAEKAGSKKNALNRPDEASSLHKTIVAETKKLFSHIEESSRKKVLGMIDSIVENDTERQITLIPYFFFVSSKQRKQRGQVEATSKDGLRLQRPQYLLQLLGTANLCGWIGYSIIDDILDGDGNYHDGNRDLIVPALVCIRHLTAAYESLSCPAVTSAFRRIMSLSDTAHDWETKRCRLTIDGGKCLIPETIPFDDGSRAANKSFNKGSDKSLGHALGPLTILILGNTAGNGQKTLLCLEGFFQHYLTARQWNDDAHDWQEDLERGRLTPVTSLVLETWKKQRPKDRQIDLKKSLSQLRAMYWNEVIVLVCKHILDESDKATADLEALSLPESGYFLAMIERQRSSAEKALQERAFVREMLKLI